MATQVLRPEPTAAPAKVGNRYPALDGLRAVAVLGVVLTHIGFQTGQTFHGNVGALLSRLDIGVTIFFLLSGFLLYSPFVRAELAGRPHPPVGTYLRNRALRILPAYWAAVLVVPAIMAPKYFHPGELLRQALLLQTYAVNHLVPGINQTWSLVVEVGFYLLLPVFAWSVRHRGLRGQVVLLSGLVVTSVLWIVVTFELGTPDRKISGLWLPHFLDWFALGMGLAVLRAWHDRTGRGGVLDQIGDASGTCWAVAALFFWLTATPLGGPRGLEVATLGQTLTKHLLYGVAATFLLLPAVFGTDDLSPVRRLLESRPARWMGKVSYGVFLWHLLVLHLTFQVLDLKIFTGHALLVTAVVLPVSLLVAAVSLRVIEEPAMRRRGGWLTAGR